MRLINDIARRVLNEVGGSIVERSEDGIAAQLRNTRFIASNGGGWDHVSISCADRCPTWGEMEAVLRLCFDDDETAIHYRPKASEYKNVHNYCLHWWRFQHAEIPYPPKEYV